MKKALVAGLLITTVSTSCFSPVNTFAESNTTYLQPSSILGPAMDRLSNSISKLGSQTPLIQGYGLIILQQPDLDVNTIYGITTDQGTARNHVRDWLDTYNPKLFKVNQDIQSFGITFTNYYNTLVELAGKMNEDPQAKALFVRIFNLLQGDVQKIQYNIKINSEDLNNFKDDLVEDSNKFSIKVTRAFESYKSSNGDIEKLRTEMGQLNAGIQEDFEKLLALPKENLDGSLNITKSVINILKDGVKDKTVDVSNLEAIYNQYGQLKNDKVTELNKAIAQKQQKLIQLVQNLSTIEVQATQMTLIEQQLNNFTRTVKNQTQSFDNLVSSWDTFNNIMIQTGTSLNADTKIDSNSLQARLKELKQFTNELKKQTTEYQESVTKIKVTG
ncbi:HBL/NHE enterotoxin family protein [Bacillus cereus]|uniref:non-hemolytic enterotoxin subunit A n=1 Tax=Bacillus cereus group TaxID=86661 RepID=UPI001F57F95D|nr:MULTISPECIES: HBL/NHE enterotoxin family protein [Bacillus cereus group]MCU4991536.1 HBL/NHE enterotoxin family protein [Bacillus cereus]USL16670.1 HBL/NHE enterotoxin family protein [Bacillus thuringiensis]